MAYKKTSPSLQDSIEVFLDQVQLIDATSQKLNKKAETITRALSEVKNIDIKPNLTDLELKIQEVRLLKNSFETMMNKQKSDFQEILKKSNSSSLYNLLTVLICIIISGLLLYFSVKTSLEKKELTKQLEISKRINKDLGSFIKSKKLENEFYKFQDGNKNGN